MQYIIDANNLAGKMGLLKEENFDKMLLKELSKFFSKRKCGFYLVFDSADPMGDKYKERENVTVIYTPRDNYYKSADDKILEVLARVLKEDEVSLITNDRDLKKGGEKISREMSREKYFQIEDSVDFANRVQKGKKTKNIKTKSNLNKEDVKEINKEILDKFNRI